MKSTDCLAQHLQIQNQTQFSKVETATKLQISIVQAKQQ